MDNNDIAYYALSKRASQITFDKEAGIKVAFRRILPEIGRGIAQFGRTFTNRLGASGKAVGADFKQHAGWLSKKNPNAVAEGWQRGDSLARSVGGPGNYGRLSMQGSTPRAQKMMQMAAEDYGDVVNRAKNRRWFSNPFDRDAVFMSKILKDTDMTNAMVRSRAMVQGTPNPNVTREAQEEFMKGFRQFFRNDEEFARALKHHGRSGFNADGSQWSKGRWIGHNMARGAGNVAGPMAVFGPLTLAPAVGAEWVGGASSLPQAKSQATRGAIDGGMDYANHLLTQPIHRRMGYAINPSRGIEDLYNLSPQGRFAHHYMFGGGRNEQIQIPGWKSMLNDLINPLAPGDFADRWMQAMAAKQMQKLGSYPPMTKEANRAMGWAAKGLSKARGGVDDVLNRVKGTRAGKWVDEHIPRLPEKGGPPPVGSELTRWNMFKHQLVNHPSKMFGITGGTAMLFGYPVIRGFNTGRQKGLNSAYNAGYGGGQAFAAEQYDRMPALQRMGASISPDMTLHFLKKKYPELYAQYADRHLPEGMR